MFRLEKITTAHPCYGFVERLWISAFPGNERRDEADQRHNTDHNPLFSCLLALEDGRPAGMFTLWDFGDFTYCEHFATDPALRGRGLGARIVSEVMAMTGKPLVLEVEMPADEMSRRRIGFYERCGLVCHHGFEYMQPPYRPGDAPLPMKLMSSPELKPSDLASAAAIIHKKVYNYNVTD
ncbi:MAG: GNAT family N-acetyltransferase [Muribaculaceae bacterium]|nr:GNAT family N-acetyltransferase [Muribaculaceae bacterium]